MTNRNITPKFAPENAVEVTVGGHVNLCYEGWSADVYSGTVERLGDSFVVVALDKGGYRTFQDAKIEALDNN